MFIIYLPYSQKYVSSWSDSTEEVSLCESVTGSFKFSTYQEAQKARDDVSEKLKVTAYIWQALNS